MNCVCVFTSFVFSTEKVEQSERPWRRMRGVHHIAHFSWHAWHSGARSRTSARPRSRRLWPPHAARRARAWRCARRRAMSTPSSTSPRAARGATAPRRSARSTCGHASTRAQPPRCVSPMGPKGWGDHKAFRPSPCAHVALRISKISFQDALFCCRMHREV